MPAALRRNPRPGRHRLESLVAARRLAPTHDSPWLPDPSPPQSSPGSVPPESRPESQPNPSTPESVAPESRPRLLPPTLPPPESMRQPGPPPHVSPPISWRPAAYAADPELTAPLPRVRAETDERSAADSEPSTDHAWTAPSPSGAADPGPAELSPGDAWTASSTGTAEDHLVTASAERAPDSAGAAWRSAPGRLVRAARRWLPGEGRWLLDPGRRGAIALAVVVLLAAAVAAAVVWGGRPTPEPAPALAVVGEPSSTGSAAPTASPDEIVVSVAGHVVSPGLVRLPADARVADAVAAAGGPTPEADLTGVNLARKLTDGEHVVVGAPGATGQDGSAAGPAADGGSGGKLDLNTATLAELDALPGVGPVTAQKILDWRERHGRFTSVDQLREIDGIGETRFARLQDLVLA